ncbi:flavin reductase [Nocardia nova]|jgi:flavin reductase (DIM6/NTAB) family NADH-FMN oxidoreductase RutF/2-polyprenyl-6-methoxyphenol hydroxylase-like FAD-dependent oxidoreductase|uniref:flavin reductase n=1 Tax=Nocardia nova TaxID=37330 RepID=UPI0007A49741|nr:flavin reductase [Nocardia nova]
MGTGGIGQRPRPRRVAIIGAGQAGALLALGLRRQGCAVTLISDRTAAEIRAGAVLSSQCLFGSARRVLERISDLEPADAPDIARLALTVEGTGTVVSALENPAQSVDYRVSCAALIDAFVAEGGSFAVEDVTPEGLDGIAAEQDLTIVATGTGDLGRMFVRDRVRSPFDRPKRALAVAYVRGLEPDETGAELTISIAPGVGEVITLPALTTTGPCSILVFEGVPEGPMDCFDDVYSPQEHLQRCRKILDEVFPKVAARARHIELTDDGGVLRGRVTPGVRRPVTFTQSGHPVLGLGDAVVLNDPITAQGANNAVHAAGIYLDSILQRGTEPFDTEWMRTTFESYWRSWGRWSVAWTNRVVDGVPEHVLDLLGAAADEPSVAALFGTAFDDPSTAHDWWFDRTDAERVLDAVRSTDHGVDPRALRNAFGQYATGVTVVTTRAPDGRKVGVTANSFTSVSLDPPLVAWCPAKKAPSMPDLMAASHFAVNVLASDQHELSRQFATPAADKFAGVAYHDGIAGVPLLDRSIAYFQCRTVNRVEAGDHIIFIGEVEHFDTSEGAPLVFHSGGYRIATEHPDFAGPSSR